MKLKTLKDIYLFIPGNKTERSLGNKSVKAELRQEAIKWIKELQSADYNTITNGVAITEENYFQSYPTKGIILWITHFFNITEEELK